MNLRCRHHLKRQVKATRRFLITGRVQGVAFRYHTRLEALRLGLSGVARNLPDGTVEVIAHGPPEALEHLKAWLHRGPVTARVVEVKELETGIEGEGVAAGQFSMQ